MITTVGVGADQLGVSGSWSETCKVWSLPLPFDGWEESIHFSAMLITGGA